MCFIDLERRIFPKMDAILIANDCIIIAHCGISGGMVGNVSCQLKASRLSQENDSKAKEISLPISGLLKPA